ncbi:MAG: RNA recognition motif domain-containing protein [Desulfomonilaceae bacterium]
MSIKIYVGNLSFDSGEEDLKTLFEAYGAVDSARIIVDQFTNRSRGFGFIEMQNREEGLKAIQELDSKDLGGRSLKVNEARPKASSGGGERREARGSRW